MGVPGYEAEYAAENAKDVESALEFLNNAKNAGARPGGSALVTGRFRRAGE